MGVIIFAALFGLAIAGWFVQFAMLRRQSFSFRTVAVSAVIAIMFVALVATVVGYFVARVRINDHYEVNSTFMLIVVVGPAMVGALVGTVVGGFIARYNSTVRP
jgi:ABC-type molybdate transport system permease subunit